MHVCPKCGYSDSELVKKKHEIDFIENGVTKCICGSDYICSNNSEKPIRIDTEFIQYEQMKEKAKKWDDHNSAFPTSVCIEKNYLDGLHKRIDEYSEKAKKWDDLKEDSYELSAKPWVRRLTEKADKWDEWCNTEPGKDVNEWKEKAKTWDDLVERFHFTGVAIYEITAWREKAKKWDSVIPRIRYILDLD